jgi:Outer membrane lipoprotein-sorting protein
MSRRSRVPLLLACCALAISVSASAQTPAQVQGWLEAVDATRNAFEEAVITARATQVVAGAPQGSADFDIYTKGRDRGLIVFRGGKNNGRKILTSGDRMWLLVPGASNPVPVTPNQRLLGGASMGDVARLRFAEDFQGTARPGVETVGGHECRVLDLKAKSLKAAYPHVVLWYDPAARLPVKVLFFLPSGKEAKEVTFTKFRTSHGKTIVSEMEIRDLLARDNQTITRLEYRDYKPAKLSDEIFTPEGALGFS